MQELDDPCSTLTITRTIPLSQTDTPDRNRHDKPYNQRQGVYSTIGIVEDRQGQSRAGPKGRRDCQVFTGIFKRIRLTTFPQVGSNLIGTASAPLRVVALPHQELKQVCHAIGVAIPLKRKLPDSAQTALSGGKKLVWLRQPSFFKYPQ